MTIDPGVTGMLEGGGKSLSWDGKPPLTHKITIESARTQQATEMGTGKPRFFDSGDPIMDIVVHGHIDPDGPDDDGSRRLFLKNDAIRALREAVKAAGAPLAPGGVLAVQYYADEQKPNGRVKKLYKAQYRPPAPTAAANDLLGAPTSRTARILDAVGFPDVPPAAPAFDPFVDS